MYYRHRATKYIRIFFQVNRHYNRITLAVPLIFMEMQSMKKRDRTNENFVPTTRRLMRRCDQMSQQFGANVYMVVRRNQRRYDHNSANDPLFPRAISDLVSTMSHV